MIAFDYKDILLRRVDGEVCFPSDDIFEGYKPSSLVFDIDGERACAFNLSDKDKARLKDCGVSSVGLRESYQILKADDFRKAAKASELIYWDWTERYCRRCGAPLRRSSEISKKCCCCDTEYFPGMTPAVLVLVKRGEEALLVHARNFSRPEMMALVAGFVETGESLEECVEREVQEETSLKINNVKYFGSQSWPFPSQMMIAFTAEYNGGELKMADGELSSAGWFSRKEPAPELPTPPSLSRELIDAWLDGRV